MGTEMIQVRPDPRTDPDGSRMGRFIAAHLLLERKVARRVFLVHVMALLGVPLFLCIAVPSLHSGLQLTFAFFGVALAAVLWALYDENVHRVAARRAAAGVDVTTLDRPR
jgi:hypothetical protein